MAGERDLNEKAPQKLRRSLAEAKTSENKTGGLPCSKTDGSDKKVINEGSIRLHRVPRMMQDSMCFLQASYSGPIELHRVAKGSTGLHEVPQGASSQLAPKML